jgi:uncharacterized protein YfcZ (UPF0381/DUF406 family)
MTIAFYVIRDKTTGKYYEARRFESTLENCRGHFEKAANAEAQLKKLQGDGYDVSDTEICGIELKVAEVIQPKIMKQKSGFVIEIKDPEAYRGRTLYYKGNKAKPFKEDSQFSIYMRVTHDGREQTITATIFATRAEAEKRLAEIKNAIDTVKYEPKDGRNYYRDDEELKYKKSNQLIKFRIIPVGGK